MDTFLRKDIRLNMWNLNSEKIYDLTAQQNFRVYQKLPDDMEMMRRYHNVRIKDTKNNNKNYSQQP